MILASLRGELVLAFQLDWRVNHFQLFPKVGIIFQNAALCLRGVCWKSSRCLCHFSLLWYSASNATTDSWKSSRYCHFTRRWHSGVWEGQPMVYGTTVGRWYTRRSKVFESWYLFVLDDLWNAVECFQPPSLLIGKVLVPVVHFCECRMHCKVHWRVRRRLGSCRLISVQPLIGSTIR